VNVGAPPAGASEWASICSVRHAVCVHAPPEVAPSQTFAALSAAERAWDVLTGALALPPPDRDLEGAWRVYLVDDDSAVGTARLELPDPRAHYDRGITFALVDRSIPAGCALDFALARALSQAGVLQAAPATDDGAAQAEAEALARLAVPCEDRRAAAQEFQQHPERTLVDASSSDFAAGGALFFDWLDATFGREPGGLLLGLLALSPTRTPPHAIRWNAAQTAFDVLRVSLRGALGPESSLDDVFARFAVHRVAMAPPPRLAWHISWPTRARRLAASVPVSPTGASYVMVDHQGAPPGAKLRMEAEWEDYGRMRWFAVKLDADGRTMAVVPVTSLNRATRAAMTIESLDAVDHVILVGVNVGSTEHRFDPDQGEWEPHGWLLTLAGE
jgi:hypothetical protein